MPDCSRPIYVKKRGWCSRHYNRWCLSGDPEAPVGRIYGDDEKRFRSKFEETSSCWLWTSLKTHAGYGLFCVTTTTSKRHVMAHRWAYERWIGPIPDGMQLDHLCRVRNCVNPAHLEPVTQAENLRRENIATGRTGGACRERDCGRPLRAIGMCAMHYQRWKKAGRPPLD